MSPAPDDSPPETDPPPASTPAQDQGTLGAQIANVLQEELRKVITGTSADLAVVATRIANNAVAAAASGRPDLVEECRAQARILLEENRIRAVSGSWAAVEAVLGAVIRTLAVAATSAGSIA